MKKLKKTHNPFRVRLLGGFHSLNGYYSFSTQQPNQSYIVTAHAETFPIQSILLFFDPQQQQLVLIQTALVATPNSGVQFAGILPTPGQYLLLMLADTPESLGSYTITFDCQACAAPITEDTCVGGGPFSLAPIAYDQSISCELTTSDNSGPDLDNRLHYLKYFSITPRDEAGPYRITVETTHFKPFLYILSSGIPLNQGRSPLEGQFNQAGAVEIIVTTEEPELTGPFTITLTRGN